MHGVIPTVDTQIDTPKPAMTVEYARTHIKALSRLEDALIGNWILGAAQLLEGLTGRQTNTCTRELWLDRFPAGRQRIELPRPPLQSVVRVEYIDGNGDLQTFSDGASPEVLSYQTKAPAGTYARPGWIEPIAGLCWPGTRCESGAVRIRYVAGYEDVPELLRGVLCYLVGNFDQVRNAETTRTGYTDFPIGIAALIDEFKYSALPTSVPRSHEHGWPR